MSEIEPLVLCACRMERHGASQTCSGEHEKCREDYRRACEILLERDEQIVSVVTWLADQGFPADWHSVTPAPAFLKRLLAEEHARRDGEDPDDYFDWFDAEQEWR